MTRERDVYFLCQGRYVNNSSILIVLVTDVFTKERTLFVHLTDGHVRDVILTSVRCHPKNIREGSICSEVFEKFIGKNRSLTCPNKILDM